MNFDNFPFSDSPSVDDLLQAANSNTLDPLAPPVDESSQFQRSQFGCIIKPSVKLNF